MSDFSFDVGEPFEFKKPVHAAAGMSFTKPQPNPSRTYDRNIAGGGFEVRAALSRAHDSLP
jgi:hypothetical protein